MRSGDQTHRTFERVEDIVPAPLLLVPLHQSVHTYLLDCTGLCGIAACALKRLSNTSLAFTLALKKSRSALASQPSLPKGGGREGDEDVRREGGRRERGWEGGRGKGREKCEQSDG